MGEVVIQKFHFFTEVAVRKRLRCREQEGSTAVSASAYS